MTIDIADLDGSGYERGMKYGLSRRQKIQAYITNRLASLSESGIADPMAYLARMLCDTDFLPSINKYAPDLLDEVRGLACGAEQPFELMFAAQLLDEEWAYREAAGRAATQKCSTVALSDPDNGTIIGQNMDLERCTDGHQLMVRIAPFRTLPGALLFSIDGMIGLLGVNTRHIGVCVNAIPQLSASRTGMPVTFVVRRILQSHTLAEAADVVNTLPHATPQHYLIADVDTIRSFEASPASVVEYHSPDPYRVFHTNHPLAQSFSAPLGSGANSLARLRALEHRLATGRQNLASIKEALSSRDDPEHPVSRDGRPTGARIWATNIVSFTTGSMISSLHPDEEKTGVWVCPGPPTPLAYTSVSLSRT